MKRILVIVSIIIMLIGLYLGYQAFTKKSGEALYNFVNVESGDVVQKVAVTGSVMSDQTIDLQFEIIGKIKEIPVEVGQQVYVGDTLMTLSNNELISQVNAASAALSMAQAKLNKALEGTRPEEIAVYETAVQKAEDDLVSAETDLKTARQDLIDTEADAAEGLNQAHENGLDSVRSGYTKADNSLLKIIIIRKAYFYSNTQLDIRVQTAEDAVESKLDLAKDALDKAELDNSYENIDAALLALKLAFITLRDGLADIRSFMDDPSLTTVATDKTLIDTERTITDTSMAVITAAQQTISSTKVTNQININTDIADVTDAENDLEGTKSNLQRARDELALRKAGATKADLDLARAEVRQVSANLSSAQDKLSKATLISPVVATITAINFELGETVSTNQTAITMIDADSFQVEANISETDIAKVKIGNEAEMTLDAFGPDEKFLGRIIQIDPAETVISGVIYYKIKSIFEYVDPRIRSGMTVNIDIITEVKENILFLPFFAVKQTNGTKYVEVLQNNQVVQKNITTGLEGETNIEILEGVSIGQKVITGEK